MFTLEYVHTVCSKKVVSRRTHKRWRHHRLKCLALHVHNLQETGFPAQNQVVGMVRLGVQNIVNSVMHIAIIYVWILFTQSRGAVM